MQSPEYPLETPATPGKPFDCLDCLEYKLRLISREETLRLYYESHNKVSPCSCMPCTDYRITHLGE